MLPKFFKILSQSIKMRILTAKESPVTSFLGCRYSTSRSTSSAAPSTPSATLPVSQRRSTHVANATPTVTTSWHILPAVFCYLFLARASHKYCINGPARPECYYDLTENIGVKQFLRLSQDTGRPSSPHPNTGKATVYISWHFSSRILF